ncbi:hypothetical protein GCM10029964_120780 [Kibdelosporangium lantanae]
MHIRILYPRGIPPPGASRSLRIAVLRFCTGFQVMGVAAKVIRHDAARCPRVAECVCVVTMCVEVCDVAPFLYQQLGLLSLAGDLHLVSVDLTNERLGLAELCVWPPG